MKLLVNEKEELAKHLETVKSKWAEHVRKVREASKLKRNNRSGIGHAPTAGTNEDTSSSSSRSEPNDPKDQLSHQQNDQPQIQESPAKKRTRNCKWFTIIEYCVTFS
jgi:hypothetical protein